MGSDDGVARRRPPIRCAGAAADLSGLDLAQVRAYRAALTAEEDKVSYWRRLVQGRVDLLEAERASGEALSLADLVRVLGDTGSGGTRRRLMGVTAQVPLPELPDLDELCQMWESDPQGADEIAALVESLRIKERALSAYRTALHQRIDAATGELIMRYRLDPRAALALLPSA